MVWFYFNSVVIFLFFNLWFWVFLFIVYGAVVVLVGFCLLGCYIASVCVVWADGVCFGWFDCWVLFVVGWRLLDTGVVDCCWVVLLCVNSVALVSWLYMLVWVDAVRF